MAMDKPVLPKLCELIERLGIAFDEDNEVESARFKLMRAAEDLRGVADQLWRVKLDSVDENST
jgi:hypothetical protein